MNMNIEKNSKETSSNWTEEKLKISLGLKKDAKLFYDELKKAVYELCGELYDEKDFWDHVARSNRQSETDYIYENKSSNLFGNADVETVLDKTFVSGLTKRKGGFSHWYEARLAKFDSDNQIINEELYEICNDPFDLTKTEMISDTVQKYYLYNFKQKKWDEADMVGTAFMKGRKHEGFIDIYCKNEDPKKVKDLFIRALTRLYARLDEIEYGGTNNKRDNYLRDEVERFQCKPKKEGKNLHCELHAAYGNYGGYGGIYNLNNYDHCFKTFMSRCKTVDFVAYVVLPGCYDTSEVFYTENGVIHKVPKEKMEEAYSVNN